MCFTRKHVCFNNWPYHAIDLHHGIRLIFHCDTVLFLFCFCSLFVCFVFVFCLFVCYCFCYSTKVLHVVYHMNYAHNPRVVFFVTNRFYTDPSEDRVNTLRLRQNCRHFADDIFKCTSLNGNVWNSLKHSLELVRKGRINNIPSLVHIMVYLTGHICVTRSHRVKNQPC